MSADGAINVTPIRTDDDAVRDALRAIMSAERKLTQTQLAREIGVSGSALNQWLAGVYAGDNPAIEAKLRIWVDAYHSRRRSSSQMPAAPEWVATPTGQRIISALAYAQVAGDIAIIYGGAGVGKTSAIRHYALGALNVWHVTMTPASASVVTALEEICAAIGINEQGGAARLHRAIVRRVRSTGGLIVIDEAQHLSTAALDQIRSIHDATGIGIALVGNTEVYARMTGGSRAAYLDRLYSRIGKRVHVRGSTADDVAAMIDAWRVDKSCRATLADIARRPGALRALTKVLRLAGMHALAEDKSVGAEHVARAWRELGGEA